MDILESIKDGTETFSAMEIISEKITMLIFQMHVHYKMLKTQDKDIESELIKTYKNELGVLRCTIEQLQIRGKDGMIC